MTIRSLAGVLIALAFMASPVAAADDAGLSRLMLCKDSWLDWKGDPAQLKTFGDNFRAGFTRHDNDPYFTPNERVSVMGFRVLQAYPESVGMGVGFSLLVAAPFAKARKTMERAFGRPLQHCDHSEGTNTCELDIAEKRTFMLMTADNDTGKTLVGCYYFYAK